MLTDVVPENRHWNRGLNECLSILQPLEFQYSKEEGLLLFFKRSCYVASHWKGLICLVALLLSGIVDEVLCLHCKLFQGQAMREQAHGHQVTKFIQGALGCMKQTLHKQLWLGNVMASRFKWMYSPTLSWNTSQLLSCCSGTYAFWYQAQWALNHFTRQPNTNYEAN